AKDRVSVREQRTRDAETFDVDLQAAHIVIRRLVLNELKVHELASGIVDEDDQAALVATLLEPTVVRSVNLDQFAAAFARFSR
ncbi:hypothetical protein, partial [Clostridium perfringens]